MQYRKREVIIEATQWFKNGDHPKDDRKEFIDSETGKPFLGEGEIVRYYRTPNMDGQNKCKACGKIMHNHGWLDTHASNKSLAIVCPGDFVITKWKNKYQPCEPGKFEYEYEKVED